MKSDSLAALDAVGVEPLDPASLREIGGGVPWAAVGYAVGAYLAKTVGDNWAAFKKGVREGFRKVWNA